MNGSKRRTTDVDINVAAFPKIPSTDSMLARMRAYDMMRVTHLHPNHAVKCDVANRRADLMPLFLRHAIHDEENGITGAGPALLLADKIHTFAERAVAKEDKRQSDLEDIRFCMEKMYLETGEKMPNELKILYSAGDWEQVLEALEVEEEEGHWKEIAETLDI
ncbi:hypothetical protein LshimejAT787_1204500 [Lyophyllum shimeji]|uniref:Uncharacterized protein n=1 Tax=Lyophyllum shimeji TaxID=47721 RepID=A0A9P3UUB2_LYOSH|nr:hypothetical protein LshimejAT787_1204500 [Lyophyllum shimeji]